jgi:hypothetical protein
VYAVIGSMLPTQEREYRRYGLLTLVAVPEREHEQDRDFLRSRHKIIVHQSDVRRHILSLLRRNGLHFKEQTRFKSHWTKSHYFWLDKVLVEATDSFKINLGLVLRELRKYAQDFVLHAV